MVKRVSNFLFEAYRARGFYGIGIAVYNTYYETGVTVYFLVAEISFSYLHHPENGDAI